MDNLFVRYRWGSLQRSRDLLTEFNGPTSEGLEEKGGKWECDREGKRREKKQKTTIIVVTRDILWA